MRSAFLLMLLLLALGGCGPERGIHQVGNWGPAVVFEDGVAKSFYVRQISHYYGSRLWFDTKKYEHRAIMVEEKQTWPYDQARARILWDTAPEWRREEKLDAVARWLLGPGADVHRMYLISNHGPVVIAHGAVSNPNNKWMRINLSLNDYVDAGDHIWGCIVYDGWPSEADLREPPPEEKVRRIYFPVKTVGELRNARPWSKSSKP